jgi:hypothetical protein
MYHVTWEIDIEADNPRQAAQKAQANQQKNRPNFWCGVFSVKEFDSDDAAVTIDLDEEPDGEPT